MREEAILMNRFSTSQWSQTLRNIVGLSVTSELTRAFEGRTTATLALPMDES